jgi:hypothetical protein
MKYSTFLIDPEKLIPVKGKKREIEIENTTGLKPTDILGVKLSDGNVAVSMETWKRIESAVINMNFQLGLVGIVNARLDKIMNKLEEVEKFGGKKQ